MTMQLKAGARVFDAARYIETDDDARVFLAEAFATNDPAFIAESIGVVARARGMTELATKTGLSRQSLYKSLSAEGRPELPTLIKVLTALGVQLTPTALAG